MASAERNVKFRAVYEILKSKPIKTKIVALISKMSPNNY
jgi:hypothetical protein